MELQGSTTPRVPDVRRTRLDTPFSISAPAARASPSSAATTTSQPLGPFCVEPSLPLFPPFFRIIRDNIRWRAQSPSLRTLLLCTIYPPLRLSRPRSCLFSRLSLNQLRRLRLGARLQPRLVSALPPPSSLPFPPLCPEAEDTGATLPSSWLARPPPLRPSLRQQPQPSSKPLPPDSLPLSS